MDERSNVSRTPHGFATSGDGDSQIEPELKVPNAAAPCSCVGQCFCTGLSREVGRTTIRRHTIRIRIA